jgi:C-terminal binding protein
MKQPVFVLDSAQVPHAHDVEVEREVLDACATVELLHLNSETDFEPLAEHAAGIILWHQLDLTAKIISRLTRVKVIVRNGVGYENVDIEAAAECGIPVCNVPDYGTEEVADHAMMLCLALERELRRLLDDVGQGNWRWETASACRRLRGRVFGVVGCGRIGTATALRAKPFGFEVRFYDPYVPSGYEKALGVERDGSLEELLAKADVVSLHVPLTGETRHMIDTPQLRGMKRDAFLINTSRGPVIRHLALEQALRENWIAGAALDVLEDEPLGLDLLTRYCNCILTPHSAFYSRESIMEMRRSSAMAVRDALLNRRLINQVNRLSVPKITAG